MRDVDAVVTRYAYWALLTLIYSLAASQAVQSFSYKWTTIADHEEYSLQKTLDAESPKPYIYRALMPFVVNRIVSGFPKKYLDVLRERSAVALNAHIGEKINVMTRRATESYGVITILNYVFMVVSLFALRAIAKQVCNANRRGRHFIADTSPVLFALMLALSYRVYNGFVYDHLEITVLVIYVYFSLIRSLLPCLLLLAVAIMNKETAVFFPCLGAAICLADRNMKFDKALLAKLVPEAMIVGCGFVFIRYIYWSAPGGSVEFHWKGNLDYWFSVLPWISVATTHVALIPLPRPTNIVVVVAILLGVFHKWASKPNIIRVPLVVSIAINVPLFLLFSYRDEFRNLSLTFPFVYLATVHSIVVFYSSDIVADGVRQ